MRYAFEWNATGGWLVFESAISLTFLADFVMNWSTAYLDSEGYWVIDRRQIARNYATGWMWIDLPSSIPLELIQVILGTREDESDDLLRLLRLLRLFRQLRAAQLIKVDSKLQLSAEAFNFNLRYLSLARLIAALVYLTHVLGCVWKLVASAAEATGGSSWLQLAMDDGGGGGGGSLIEEYTTCLLFSLSMLLVVGYQDMPPTSEMERLAVIASLIGGTLVFGYILSSVAELLGSIDVLSKHKSDRLAEVNEYLRWRRLPRDLSHRIRRFQERYVRRPCFRIERVSPLLSLGVSSPCRLRRRDLGSTPHLSTLLADTRERDRLLQGGGADRDASPRAQARVCPFHDRADGRSDPAACERAVDGLSARHSAGAQSAHVRKG